MKVSVDKSKCIAAGQCVFKAPLVFDQHEEDGVVMLLDAAPELSQRALIEQAINACPTRAITIVS
jgi:ferredoxin